MAIATVFKGSAPNRGTGEWTRLRFLEKTPALYSSLNTKSQHDK